MLRECMSCESTLVRTYYDHEYCLDIECDMLLRHRGHLGIYECTLEPGKCIKNAREFHKWLSKNDYLILKPEHKSKQPQPSGEKTNHDDTQQSNQPKYGPLHSYKHEPKSKS